MRARLWGLIWPSLDHSWITHSRKRTVPRGHRRTRRPRHLSSGGPKRSRKDTPGHATETVRDREAPGSNPGPPTKNRIQIEVFACSVWRAGVTGRSQIFLELGGGSPVQVDFEPSIELAHGYRTADISARARPQDRETPGFRIPGCESPRNPGPCTALPWSEHSSLGSDPLRQSLGQHDHREVHEA